MSAPAPTPTTPTPRPAPPPRPVTVEEVNQPSEAALAAAFEVLVRGRL